MDGIFSDMIVVLGNRKIPFSEQETIILIYPSSSYE